MILLVLLWCLGVQDASWPELPPKLQADEALRQRYEAELQNGTPEERREAARAIFAQLAGAEPAAQANFLLGIAGRSDLNGLVPLLEAPLRRLDASWPAFSARIEEVLVVGQRAEASDADRAAARGGLRAAGILALAEPTRVEAMAAYLDDPALAPVARRALHLVTRREFRDRDQFLRWWESASQSDRTTWILTAADQANSEVVTLWKELLRATPARALDALRHERLEIRMLALGRLGSVPADAVDTQGRSLPEVVADALRQEADPHLAAELVRQLPRVFPEGRQVEVLRELIFDLQVAERARIAACETLVQARPTPAATLALLDATATVYASQSEGRSSLPVRTKLVTSLFQVVNGNRAAADLLRPSEASTTEASSPGPLERLETALSFAIVFEDAGDIRQQLFRLVGAVGSDPHLEQAVRAAIERPQVPIEERQAAIEAFGAMAQRSGVSADKLAVLVGLLESEDPNIRYAAAGGLANTGTPAAFVRLAERLLTETSTRMSERLLTLLARGKVEETVPALLTYVPDPNQWSLYRDALEKNINGGEAVRLQAMQVMLERGDWEMAWRLDRALASPAEGTAPDPTREAIRSRAQLRWALDERVPASTGEPVVQEALRRLAQMRELEPEAWVWLRFEAELRLRLQQDAAAFAALEELLPRWPDAAEGYGGLCVAALECAQRLSAAQADAAARATWDSQVASWAAGLPPIADPAQRDQAAALVARFQAAESVASSSEEQPPPSTQSSPPPAEVGAESPGTEAPEAGAEPPTPDPANGSGGGGEPPAEEPDGGGTHRP